MERHDLGLGQSMVGFSSFEEMQDYLRHSESEAIRDSLAEQWAIDWGSWVVRFLGSATDRLWIYGELFTQELYRQSEIEAGADPEEVDWELEGVMDAYQRGYRFGRWYSQVLPEGELGTAHVSSLWPISSAEFHQAREQGWVTPPELAYRVGKEVVAALMRHRQAHPEEGEIKE